MLPDLDDLRVRWEAIATDPADFRGDKTASVVLGLLDHIDELHKALLRARECCARPAGVCLDPHWFDGQTGGDGER